jgi:16S rRNA (guanine966-N2)-methyltransferase
VSALDLYAGTGALGIEALSRGAASVVFVERAARSLQVLRANLSELALDARVVAADVVRGIRRLSEQGARFGLVFLDPPYASDELARALAALVDARLLSPGAVVVVESGRRHPVPVVEGLAALDERRYGDTLITRLAAVEPAGSATRRGGGGSA